VPDSTPPARRWRLDPADRFGESLFGLIMVLTFTSTVSAAQGGRDEVREILVGAVSCNVAWGIVDAAMYLMANLAERGREIRLVRAIRDAANPARARALLAEALPSGLGSALTAEQLDGMRERAMQLPYPPPGPRLRGYDWVAALSVFLWVNLTALPVIAPFVFMDDSRTALRVSNAIAIVLLFVAGYGLARAAGERPWRTGFAMILVGLALVGITIALGR